jgi:hypothetical protein
VVPAFVPTSTQLALLVLAALAAGTIDAIAGGGGLITLPALLAAGLPPHLALGTNKGQSVWGSLSALIAFWRAGSLDRRRARITFPVGLVGSLAGAAMVLLVPPAVLRPVVLALLVTVAVALTFRRTPTTARPEVPAKRARAALIALALGAYDGFFGPGTGTFLIMAFVILLGEPMTRATGDAKVVNFASNLAAVALFARRGVVVWQVALPMAGAQLVGGSLGAHIAVKGGEKVIRRVVLAMVVALCVKLAADLSAR